MKKALCLSAALLCLTAALVSCDSKKKDTKDNYDATAQTTAAASEKTDAKGFAGKWQCKEIEMDGEKSDNLWGADAFSLFQIEIKDDNTGSFSSFIYSGFLGSDEPIDLTWDKKDDDSIILTLVDPEEDSTTSEAENTTYESEDEKLTLTKDGDMMILDMSDDMSSFKAFLEKVDSFTPVPEDMEMSFSASSDFDMDLTTEASAE